MTDTTRQGQKPHPSQPPAGGRTDHDAMRAASMRPTSGPAEGGRLSAISGLELPGREAHTELIPSEPATPEMIPGERDGTTLTHREPGAVGGQFSGFDLPPSGVPVDDITRELVEEAAGKTKRGR